MATQPKQQESIGVFVSYSTENESLARKLKDKLLVLDDANLLDVFIAAELGGQKWRDTIHQKLADASVLILAYTNERMKLDWVCYELGRFHANSQGQAVCVMNTNIKNPPDQIADWQAYKADPENLRRFLVDLFVNGRFTNGRKINAELTSNDRYRTRLEEAIADLEAEFVAFRTREKFYARRITVASPSKGLLPSRLNFDTARVTGNEDTLSILESEDGVSWQTLRKQCDSRASTVWFDEVERVTEFVREKRMARPLTPFRAKGRTFLPVVSRVETIDSNEVIPTKVSVIFVEISDDVRLGWQAIGGFDKMPDKWVQMLSLFDVGRRFRWDIVEPVSTSVRYPQHDAPPDQWKAEAERLLKGAAEAGKQMREIGFENEAKFYSEFDADLIPGLRNAINGFPSAEERFRRAIDTGNRNAALEALQDIRKVNTGFLKAAVEQMSRYVSQLDQ